jgi:hypothetical protein
MGFYDQRPPAHSDDLTAFAQNHFNQRWLFVELFGQFDGTRRGSDIVQANCSFLGFGNNLLGNYQDIIIQQAEVLSRTSIADQAPTQSPLELHRSLRDRSIRAAS